MHDKGIKVLMNVNLNEAPISRGNYNAQSVAANIVNTLRNQLTLSHIDGVSI